MVPAQVQAAPRRVRRGKGYYCTCGSRDAGQPVPHFDDALDWAQEAAALRAACNPTIFQLTLSVATIHTSTDLLVQVVLDLAQHPGFFKPLRDEISTVLRADG